MHTVVGFDGVWSQTKQGHAAQTERERVANKLDSFRTTQSTHVRYYFEMISPIKFARY
jgi:hypothetical protein